jgi:hypothetical protein
MFALLMPESQLRLADDDVQREMDHILEITQKSIN